MSWQETLLMVTLHTSGERSIQNSFWKFYVSENDMNSSFWLGLKTDLTRAEGWAGSASVSRHDFGILWTSCWVGMRTWLNGRRFGGRDVWTMLALAGVGPELPNSTKGTRMITAGICTISSLPWAAKKKKKDCSAHEVSLLPFWPRMEKADSCNDLSKTQLWGKVKDIGQNKRG